MIDAVTVGATTRTSLVDATGSRLAWTSGGTTTWTLFDHLGSLVALVGPGAGNPLAEVYRYDGYGQALRGTVQIGKDDPTGDHNPFRFRGALNLGTDGEPLYAMGARLYAPSAGAWTSLDSYAGSAQDPSSMNRYLYVGGNPTSLIDPTGHKPEGCGSWISNAACTAISNENKEKAEKKEDKKDDATKKDDDKPTDPASCPQCHSTPTPTPPPTPTPEPPSSPVVVNTAGLCVQLSFGVAVGMGQVQVCEVKDRRGNRAILVVGGGGGTNGGGASGAMTAYLSDGYVADQEGWFGLNGGSGGYGLGGSGDVAQDFDKSTTAVDIGILVTPISAEFHRGVSYTSITYLPPDAPSITLPMPFPPVTAEGFADIVFWATPSQ